MRKVLITDGLAADGVNILKAGANFQIELRKATEPAELLSIISDYDCLVVRSATKVTREVIEKGTQLKLICRAGAGVDNVDVEAATKGQIAVMNTASANSLAAAEHTIALIFALLRQVPAAQQSLREKRWDRALYSGFEVTGKTLGVLGLGNIGKLVAERAAALKMRLCGFDPFLQRTDQLPPELRTHVELLPSVEAVLETSDIVTLHLPLTRSTHNLLNRDRLQKMKEGSWLINCARGGLVDEAAVCDLLDSNRLRGAAFDVFAEEPVRFPNRLAEHPKAVVTPHLGASTAEAQLRVGVTAAQQIVDFFTKNSKVGVLN